MNNVLSRWNRILADKAIKEILPCCGSMSWATQLVARRPVSDEGTLFAISDDIWWRLSQADWLEAFNSHPRIGESLVAREPSISRAWSADEQSGVAAAQTEAQLALREGNRLYEQRFRRAFIVCATGKSVSDILEILRRRLNNDEAAEWTESAEQQRQITQIRLRKWLVG
jgi:2-oxo-4-hydroxy-4-carboxy-5-ureidoimidazoline decarboxylase